MDFETAKQYFRDDRIRELAGSEDGLRFLKVRSLSRRAHLKLLFTVAEVTPTATSTDGMFREAYESPTITDETITKTIRQIYAAERSERREREPDLIDQLYRLQVFDWGGLHQNSLERTIVNNYVKKIRAYDQLSNCIENELHSRMRGYVLCSWYNHWTSILIEDIFRDHPAVLPAVGLVKKIDFFINGVPFDLKVTYFPEGYVQDCRRAEGKEAELKLLKQWADRHNVAFSRELPESRLIPDLWGKASDHPSDCAHSLLADMAGFRQQLIQDAQGDPTGLIRWLYENQGLRRFDAANRLFLVLVDPADFFGSWKLKRAKPLLDFGITSYLDHVPPSPGHAVEFTWDGARHSVTSDVLVVTKPQSNTPSRY